MTTHVQKQQPKTQAHSRLNHLHKNTKPIPNTSHITPNSPSSPITRPHRNLPRPLILPHTRRLLRPRLQLIIRFTGIFLQLVI